MMPEPSLWACLFNETPALTQPEVISYLTICIHKLGATQAYAVLGLLLSVIGAGVCGLMACWLHRRIAHLQERTR